MNHVHGPDIRDDGDAYGLHVGHNQSTRGDGRHVHNARDDSCYGGAKTKNRDDDRCYPNIIDGYGEG